jgi:hypothetical protein
LRQKRKRSVAKNTKRENVVKNALVLIYASLIAKTIL